MLLARIGRPCRMLATTPLAVLIIFAGCATTQETPQQVKTRADYTECADSVGVRGLDISIAPTGAVTKWGSFVSHIDRNAMIACLVAKGRRIDAGGGQVYRGNPPSAAAATAQQLAVAPSAAAPITQQTAISASPITPTSTGAPLLPTWAIGDEWSYRWESPRGKGTFVRAVGRL